MNLEIRFGLRRWGTLFQTLRLAAEQSSASRSRFIQIQCVKGCFVKIFSRLFSKSPADLLAKGDRLFDAERFFDARTCYEEGLQGCSDGNQKELFKVRIDKANVKLAELNLAEAEFAFSRGDSDKAIDHLELVKTLTYDVSLREKAEKLLKELTDAAGDPEEALPSSSCASCSHTHVDDYTDGQHIDDSLHPLEYFELLIRQLPETDCQRYAKLGEDFAYAYVAACQDRHGEALSLFEKWSSESSRDIYYCERAKILHRLGNDREAEQNLRSSIQINPLNSLACLNLALLLIDSGRFEEAIIVLDAMISNDMMPEQAMLMRGEIFEAAGDQEGAIDQYSRLLMSPYGRAAAEKLHTLLITAGRHNDAALLFKQYLGKCSH